MKVLIVSQYYPPEPVPIPHEIAQALSERGHSVRVLTAFPNYPAGELYPGYRQSWRQREHDGDVVVQRAPLYVDHSRNPLARLANYVSFGFSSAMCRRFARGADVIYIYATQMTPALGPWLWRLTGGAPYVLHVQDLWPDSILGSSMVTGGRSARLIEATLTPWLRSVYRHAAAVVAIAPTMVETLITRGVSAQQAELVFNWAGRVRHRAMARMRHADKTRVLYAGNVGDMQDLETAVNAAHLAADAGVQLTIVGDGVARQRVRTLAANLGATNVSFLDPIPRDQMGGLYEDADFGLITLKDLPVFRATIPSKFQSVLAHGLPAITSVQGDVRALTDELDVGLTADAESVQSLETAFRAAAALSHDERAAMASRAREAYEARFSFEAGVARLEEILTKAAVGRREGAK